MATYVLLNLTASGTGVTQTIFREAINGCRRRQDYQYQIIFVSARNAIVALNDAYNSKTFEDCVDTKLNASGGSVSGMVVIHEGDLGQFSHAIQTQILQLVQQIQNDGNTVEGF